MVDSTDSDRCFFRTNTNILCYRLVNRYSCKPRDKAFPRYLPDFLVRHTSPFGFAPPSVGRKSPSVFLCQFILVTGLCEDVNSRSCVPLLPTPFISGNFRTPKEKKRVPPIFSFYREQYTPLPPIYMKSEGGLEGGRRNGCVFDRWSVRLCFVPRAMPLFGNDE
ncbi:hypothetical protein CDAR_391261 [Caerostris darwini]|uniref:Uncharacterized protein n=1 Tax=Caerostris darwini TaxID=1538125 RepID=A0AAV4SW79_9ARAC|nr:hypothetical protein CDAR_391261 [Caerostris darwini]